MKRPNPDVTNAIELSILMPCLNEAETLEHVLRKRGRASNAPASVARFLWRTGSHDSSVQIAEECGARVVHLEKKGYGNALAGGIHAAAGRWIVMGDADRNYDFSEADHFVKKFR